MPHTAPSFDDAYARRPALRWLALAAGLLAWTFDGVEQGIYAVMTRDALKDLIPAVKEDVEELNALRRTVEERASGGVVAEEESRLARELAQKVDEEIGWYFGISLAMWLWGAAAGGVIFGRLGDRYGRVRPLMVAVVTYSFFTGLTAFSQSWTHLAACRFLGALGLGGAWPLSVALLVETWPERNRSVLAGCMGAGANVGYLLAATYSRLMSKDYSWRWVIGVGCLIGVSSLLVIAFVPETTAWKRARETRQRSSIADLFSKRYRRSTIVGSLLATVALLGTWGSFLWIATYVDQIAEGTAYQKDAKSIVQQWSAYGQIAGGFLGGVLAGWLGNKRSWRILCVGAWASVVALFWFNEEFGYRMLVMGAIAGLFVTAFFGWLPKFLPELYPTRIRATGQGFSYNIGRVLTGIGALGAGSLVAAFGGSYQRAMIGMATVYLLGLVVVLFAPDTGGKMLDDDDEAG